MQYRSIPKIVDAEQFFVDKKPWPKGVYPVLVFADGHSMGLEPTREGVTIDYLTQYDDTTYYFAIDTPRGTLKVFDKDWIVEGEFYPCKPAIFEQTYEVVE